MTGPWQATPNDDADIVPCDRCGADVVLDHTPPCPHGYAACDGCGHAAVCRDCYTAAQAEMFATGIYNPDVDTSIDNTPEALARHEQWWAELRAFDPASFYRKNKP